MHRRRRIAALVVPVAWITLAATPAAAAEPCVTVVICDQTAEPAPEPAPEPEPEPEPAPTTPTTTPPPAAQPARQPAAQPSQAEAAAHLLRRMNEERAARGLPPLQRRGDVDAVAQDWSGRLADERRLSHNDAFFTPESRARHGAKALGENVAVNQSPEAAHVALMNSERHRDNILDARFSVVGLGAVFRDGSWWITQDFVQPRAGGASPPAPAPSAPPVPASTTPPSGPRNRPRIAAAGTPSAEAPAPTQSQAASIAAVPGAAAAPPVVQTFRAEPDRPARSTAPTFAADAATPTPKAAVIAALVAASGWVVLALTRRGVRRTSTVMPRSGHRPIPTRLAG